MEAGSQGNQTQADAGMRNRGGEATGFCLLRRFFPIYCVLTAVVTFGYALWDNYQLDGDAVAYMDIGDYLRAHQWGGVVNGYWHPMYPAFLSLGHVLLHATLATELRAYYMVNFGIFLLEMVAVVAIADAIAGSRFEVQGSRYLLGRYAMRYLGLALLVIASQRELSLGKVRPDALLQAFLLFAVAALLRHLTTGRVRYAALMGLALGCAYLTKSFAFVFAFLCIGVLVALRWLRASTAPRTAQNGKFNLVRAIAAGAVAFVCFGVVAGPYVAALSRQHGRFDFGDSGSLNYAWYVGGTEKMHLEPYMTGEFGSAEVHLKHPERELMRSPQVLSYAALPYGTYPDWFDTTYWNDQVKPHLNPRGDVSRFARNCVLVVRYLFNHPEALILLGLLMAMGARLRLEWRLWSRESDAFWIAPLLLGVAIWGIYAIVNTEERYVTVAYLMIILTLFATLQVREGVAGAKAPIHFEALVAGTKVPAYQEPHFSAVVRDAGTEVPAYPKRVAAGDAVQAVADDAVGEAAGDAVRVAAGDPVRMAAGDAVLTIASALVLLLALLAVGESLRTVLEDRRELSGTGYPYGWRSEKMSDAAQALKQMGVEPGDTVACVGEEACLNDPYWARLAGVRILTEIYDPDTPVYPFLAALPNRGQVIGVVRAQGGMVLVGDFDTARVSDADPFFRQWRQLDSTTMYALPLQAAGSQ